MPVALALLAAGAAISFFVSGNPLGPAEEEARDRADPAGAGLFLDVTSTSGIDFVHGVADGRMDDVLESVGSGVVIFDHDGDERLDVFLVQADARGRGTHPLGTSRLFRNLGGMRFADVTERAGLSQAGGGFSGAAGDYDGDGDMDLFLFRDGPNRLFRNVGDGRFEEAAAEAGIAGTACSVAGTLLDVDGDGHLDLFVANYLRFDPGYQLHYQPDVFPGPLAFAAERDVLYRNRGDGTFLDASDESGLVGEAGRAMGVVACDFDDDGRADVFVANDATANHYYRNLGGGRFKEEGARSGVAYGFHGEATGAMAGSVGDVNGDGRPDLHVTDTHFGSLYGNAGSSRFRDRCYEAGIAAISAPWVSWGGGFLDLENDGDLDLFIANGDLHYATGRPDLLLENDGAGRFVSASERGGPHFERQLPARAAALADLDDDGTMDVLITHVEGPIVLLRGRPRIDHHWVRFRVRGAGTARHGLGARVSVRAGQRRWIRHAHAPTGYLAQGDPRLHIGLRRLERVDSVRVRWPSGGEETFGPFEADRTHDLVEGRGTR